MTAVAIHPTIAGTAVVGAAGGGLWKTTDSGATWTPLNDGLPSVPVWQVVVNRAGDTMFAVTHGRGVYRAHRRLYRRPISFVVGWLRTGPGLRAWIARLLGL